MQFVPVVLISALFAVVAARLGCEIFRQIALKIRLVDKPDAVRKLQNGAIPVGGGAVVFLAFFFASVLAASLNAELGAQMQTLLVSFATVGAFVVGFGLIDDKKGMNGLVKLFLQIVAASIVVVFAKDYSKIEFFGREFELGHFFYPLAVFWLVGVMNAFNFLDGADGVVATVGFFSFVAIGTLGVVNEYLGGRLPLFHFDMYRLASSDDLWDIGWEDYLERGGVCAVEWSENVDDAMEQAIYVTIQKLGGDARRIIIEGGECLADLSL